MATKYNTKPITDTEIFAIKGMLSEGLSLETIAEQLNRSPKSKKLKEIISEQNISERDEDSCEEKSVDIKSLELWEDAISEAQRALKTRGIEQGAANVLVSEALSKIDLDTTPDHETIMSFIFVESSRQLLTKPASGVVASNALASEKDDTGPKRPIGPPTVGTFYKSKAE